MGALALPISALDAVNWSYSEDQDIITNGTTKYYRYENAGYLSVYPKEQYVFENKIRRPTNTIQNNVIDYNISAHARDTDVIWLDESIYGSGYCDVYATKEGAARLDKLIKFEDCVYYLAQDDYSDAELSEDTVKLLTSLYRSPEYRKQTFKVVNLKSAQHFVIYAYDQNLAFRRALGSIFYMNGNMYFVEYALLSNNHFTSDNRLSFRSGEVQLVQLPAEDFSLLKNTCIGYMSRYSTAYTYEMDELEAQVIDGEYNENGGKIVFWITYFLVCFVTPIPTFILGLILPHLKKLGKRKYWYSLTVSSGLCILTGIRLMMAILL